MCYFALDSLTKLKDLVPDDGPNYISEDALNQAVASSRELIQAWLQDLDGNNRLNPSESPNIEPSASSDSLEA